MGHRRSVLALATTAVMAAGVLMAPADAQELVAAGGFFRAAWSVPPLPRPLTNSTARAMPSERRRGGSSGTFRRVAARISPSRSRSRRRRTG